MSRGLSGVSPWVIAASVVLALVAVLAVVGGIQVLADGEGFDAGVGFLVVAALLLALAGRVLAGGRLARWTAVGLPAFMFVSTLLQGYPSAAGAALVVLALLAALLFVPRSAREHFRAPVRV